MMNEDMRRPGREVFDGIGEDWRWSDWFGPDIGAIVGRHLFVPASLDRDRYENTDMTLATMQNARISIRVRRHEYLARYAGEFTVRAARPATGHETELSKVIGGLGDYTFYGFADEAGRQLEAWFLGDLRVFRVWFASELAKLPPGELPGRLLQNWDGTADFRVFDVAALPPAFVVASSPGHPGIPNGRG